MSPPAVIEFIVRPAVFIMELKKAVIRAVSTDKCAFFVARLIFIDPFPIQPFVKGSTMVKYTVQDHFHASFVDRFHQLDEQLIAGFQIFFVGHTVNISFGMGIVFVPVCQQIALVMNDLSKMRIHIVIILNVILVVRR